MPETVSVADFEVDLRSRAESWSVVISGIAEIVLGILLVVPRFSRMAAWGLIALLIAVSPANIHMALHPDLFPEFRPVALLIRLPLQLVLIAWAFVYTRPRSQPS